MSTIQEIMQVGVGMPDREAFARFSCDVLGFPTSTSEDGSVTYMRTDRYPHRLVASMAEKPALNYVCFDVGGPDELSEWKKRLTAKDINCQPGNPEECRLRGVADFIEFKDPDGHTLALSHGFQIARDPVHYARESNVIGL